MQFTLNEGGGKPPKPPGGYEKMAKGGLIFRGLRGFKGANPLNPLIFSNFWVKEG